MVGRFTRLLLVPVFLFCSISLFAGENDYVNHKKYFYLCSITKDCFYCESCAKEMYKIKIRNNADKRIKSVYYQYYSPLYQKVITKEAVIEGDQIDNQNTGILYVCVTNRFHWAISKIVYEDNSDANFLVDVPLRKYHQEPDECNCNIGPLDKRFELHH